MTRGGGRRRLGPAGPATPALAGALLALGVPVTRLDSQRSGDLGDAAGALVPRADALEPLHEVR